MQTSLAPVFDIYAHEESIYETEVETKVTRHQPQGAVRRSPNKWSKEENHKLGVLVGLYGEKKWKKISQELGGGKTGAQCAQHWKRVLCPEIRKGPWDEHEEELLLNLVATLSTCWKQVAKKIPRRTDIQCRYHFLKVKQSRDNQWMPKEDEVILRRAAEMGERLSWLEISEHLTKLKLSATLRTANGCRLRCYELTGKHLPCVAPPSLRETTSIAEPQTPPAHSSPDFHSEAYTTIALQSPAKRPRLNPDADTVSLLACDRPGVQVNSMGMHISPRKKEVEPCGLDSLAFVAAITEMLVE